LHPGKTGRRRIKTLLSNNSTVVFAGYRNSYNYSGTEGQRDRGTKIFARPANLYMFLLCPEKPGPLGQVRDIWLCPGVLCLKKEHRTSNFQRRIKVRLRRFNFIKKMSDPPASPERDNKRTKSIEYVSRWRAGAISTFDVRC